MLLDLGGQDATEAFEDVGHSDEAREILDGLLLGNLKREVRYMITKVPKVILYEDNHRPRQDLDFSRA